ncbi:hypothetical protein NDU88_000168 [Pleurodeles waltl]|uniref:Uncharacterized protein n=1 Tax=Pleurodeles waltl TaxID=8319 RepID=A0AAV7SVK8_PLEWA|nr:hypothetical protein NDU88_000168 [Pleurodeles waltl]
MYITGLYGLAHVTSRYPSNLLPGPSPFCGTADRRQLAARRSWGGPSATASTGGRAYPWSAVSRKPESLRREMETPSARPRAGGAIDDPGESTPGPARDPHLRPRARSSRPSWRG